MIGEQHGIGELVFQGGVLDASVLGYGFVIQPSDWSEIGMLQRRHLLCDNRIGSGVEAAVRCQSLESEAIVAACHLLLKVWFVSRQRRMYVSYHSRRCGARCPAKADREEVKCTHAHVNAICGE